MAQQEEASRTAGRTGPGGCIFGGGRRLAFGGFGIRCGRLRITDLVDPTRQVLFDAARRSLRFIGQAEQLFFGLAHLFGQSGGRCARIEQLPLGGVHLADQCGVIHRLVRQPVGM